MTASEPPGDIPKRATRVKDLYQQLKLWSAARSLRHSPC